MPQLGPEGTFDIGSVLGAKLGAQTDEFPRLPGDSPTMALTDTACKNAKCPQDKARLRLADSGGLYLPPASLGPRNAGGFFVPAGRRLAVRPASFLSAAAQRMNATSSA